MSVEPQLEWDLCTDWRRHLDLARGSDVDVVLALGVYEDADLSKQSIANLPYLLPSTSMGQAGDVLSYDLAVLVASVKAGVNQLRSMDLGLFATFRLDLVLGLRESSQSAEG